MPTDKVAHAEQGSRRLNGQRLHDLGVSRREAEVLALVLVPYSNAQIASRLGISKRTVESHVSALLRKFTVPDRPALIRTSAPLINQQGSAADGQHRSVIAHRPDKQDLESDSMRRQVVRQRGYTELSRAVQLARNSIELHEASAWRLEDMAVRWHSQAMDAIDEQVRATNLDRAATAHQQAQFARSRAVEFRRRFDLKHTEPNS